MKNKLKTFFTTNIALKIVSLVIGFVLWAVLAYYQDPVITTSVSVPVTYVNADLLRQNEGLVMLSGPSTIQLTVSTNTSKSSDVDASMFSCTADLTDHNGGDIASQRVHVFVDQIGGKEVVLDWNYMRNDPNITVSMDRYITKEFTVELLTTDSLTEGLILGDSVTFDPAVVTVTAPETRFSNLASIKALVSLSDFTDGNGGIFTEPVALSLYDANGKVISNNDNRFTLSTKEVTMTAVVSRVRTTSVKSAGTVGSVADGYRYVSTTISPETLTIYGLKSTIGDLTEIWIPREAIDISGLSDDKTYEIDITQYLKEGVSLVDPAKAMVTLTIHVEKLVTKSFELSDSDIEVTGGSDLYEYEITSIPGEITVTGFQEDIESFRVSSLKPTVSVEGLTEGTHELTVAFTKTPGYEFGGIDNFTVEVVVKAAPEGSTEESTPGETEPATGEGA